MTAVRQPRLQVLADGAVLPGAVSAEVNSNNHLAADRVTGAKPRG